MDHLWRTKYHLFMCFSDLRTHKQLTFYCMANDLVFECEKCKHSYGRKIERKQTEGIGHNHSRC